MDKIKIACVNYINTLPFLYGLRKSGNSHLFEVFLETPSECKRLLEEAKVDIALLPIGGLLSIRELNIFSKYCIGCDGPVKTVALFSNSQIDKINTVYLDSDSVTSAKLIKILFALHWKKDVRFIRKAVSSLQLLEDEAVLMIGDKAFAAYSNYTHIYDLGEIWKAFTKLPFVFALWASRMHMTTDFLELVEGALTIGMDNIDEVIERNQDNFPNIDLKAYFNEYISYNFDDEKKQALKSFLESCELNSFATV